MEFFSGFAWAVPRAFASAVAACRFEQGDVLYPDAAAYDGSASWQEMAARVGRAVQVLDPPRSARNAPADASGNRFDANWESPVTLEVFDFAEGGRRTAHVTQGRLFGCLWRGDERLLVEGALPAEATPPAVPAGGRELFASLEQALPALRRARHGRSTRWLYAAVVDESSEASLAKLRTAAAALERRFGAAPHTRLAPDALGLAASPKAPEPRFHPALSVAVFSLETSDEEAIREALKGVLYAPTRATEPEGATASGEGDRFRLERHGLLAPAKA